MERLCATKKWRVDAATTAGLEAGATRDEAFEAK
jgi:hypothetical protein